MPAAISSDAMRCVSPRRVGEGKAACVRRQRHIERQCDLRRKRAEFRYNLVDDLSAGTARRLNAAAQGKLPAVDVVVNGEVYMTTIALGIVGEHALGREVHRDNGVRLISFSGPQAYHIRCIACGGPVIGENDGGLSETTQCAAQCRAAAERIPIRTNVRHDQEVIAGTQEFSRLLRRELSRFVMLFRIKRFSIQTLWKRVH